MESMNLVERMKSEQRKDFHPAPRYYRQGDYLTYFISSKRCYSRRIDSLLTVYTDMETGELVGCKVKGVRRLLDKLKAFGVVVKDGMTTLGLLFVSFPLVEPGVQADKFVGVGPKV